MKNVKFLGLSLIGLFFLASCELAPKQEKSSESADNQVNEKQVFNAPEWTKNANIYEVNLRQYSEEGTINAFAENLPRLKEMGVDILWFMPIHPIGEMNKKGSLGSYYAVKDYKAVNPEYGNFEDFKTMVQKAHELGMYVMLDWVANHTSWDNVWVGPHPEYYEVDENGELISPFDWTDVISLDYTNEGMRADMIDALKFWVVEANIDGYRCDVASEVPTEFWEEVRPQLQAIKPVFMLAESEQPDLLESAFDMNYGWEFHHIMNDVAKGNKGPQDIKEYKAREAAKTPERAYLMYFITNHDENSWNGTIEERLGEAGKTMAVLTYTLGGMPLIYSGQEAANNKRLEFFEKDPIDWKDYPLADFYKSLNGLKHQENAIWNGAAGGKLEWVTTNNDAQILAFKKVTDNEEIFVVFNLSSNSANLDLDVSDYQSLLSDKIEIKDQAVAMDAWGWGIFKK